MSKKMSKLNRFKKKNETEAIETVIDEKSKKLICCTLKQLKICFL
ncbi:MAG: hypothetical protein ABF289_06995 [Clostridiales bacterium]